MTNHTEFLTGKDYPDLCEFCRAAIDDMAYILKYYGPDTDDIEAPIMMVYDRQLYCGGDHCKEDVYLEDDVHPPE